MSTSPSESRQQRTSLLEEKLRKCKKLTSRIARQMDAIRLARGCDKADLVALHANMLALSRELERLHECVKSRSGESVLRSDPIFRDELSRWLSDAELKVNWISAGIEPGFDLPHGDGADWWEVWLDATELSDRMADLRRVLHLAHTPHPGS